VKRPVVGFAGLTHLGLVSAAATAAKGFRVIGYDPEPTRATAIASGRLPVVEPGLDRLVSDHASRLEFTSDAAALTTCDVVYVASDVPTTGDGVSDLAPIEALIATVVASLGPETILVVLCQVPPGFTRRLSIRPERLYYQVETLVFGRAVERATQPERFIVGCADPQSALPGPYATLLSAFDCPVLTMRYESAELAKIAINCALVASVTVANTLAELSERIGADWSEIVPALRLDRRIGQHAYLTPGLGLAGGNLERDLATVLRLAGDTGAEASVITAFARNSAHRRDWVLRTLHAEVLAEGPEAIVGILGLAYKENTHSTKNSPSLALIAQLGSWRVQVYDPAIPAVEPAHPSVAVATSALDAARGADVLVVMTPWPAFRDLKPSDLAAVMAGRALIDPYRVFDAREVVAAGLDYFTLGAAAMRTEAS
jgi:UDPglucose 6-dehydrogenase